MASLEIMGRPYGCVRVPVSGESNEAREGAGTTDTRSDR